MPFTPKFVDLVRNVTTVQGSGPAALGAAVPGYAGFAETIALGEQFYYCIQGVDKPAEREVGRGTMQAGGTILRDPIGSAATNFTGGTKTIALVAAAEWFSRIELGGQAGASGISVATRIALAAKTIVGATSTILSESGREGLFVFDPANLSAKVSSDPAQGIYVAPATAPTGASGAWVRKFSGGVDVRWFGAKGDGATNDGAAFLAALAYLKSQATVGYGYSKGSSQLFVPSGVYFLGTNTLDISHSLTMYGEGQRASGSSVLRWTAGTTGIRSQAVNTVGANGYNAAWTDYSAGNGSIIRNLALEGGYAGVESEAHGIHMRSTLSISDVYINGFPGDGIFSRAAAGSGGADEGNANGFTVDRVTVQNCRNGLYVDSADTNAGVVTVLNASGNRKWGIWDSSFLGNTYVGCHAAANGWDGAIGSIPTGCTYLGNRYTVIPGQEAWVPTNAPSGTTASNQGWRYAGAGGVYNGIVPWVSGTVFRAGGSYFVDSNNGYNIFVGCYEEGDQGASTDQSTQTLWLGGLGSQNILPGSLQGGGFGVSTPKAFRKAGSNGLIAQLGSIANPNLILGGTHPSSTPGSGVGFAFAFGHTGDGSYQTQDVWINWQDSAVAQAKFTGPQTTEQFGTGAAVPYAYHPFKLVIGAFGNGRLMGNDIVVPAAGAHAQGEIVWNRDPTAGSPIGWSCITAGTPGTWKAFYGPTSNADAIGYATGAGGAVTQLTSKATGVTLNKASGQITLTNASLAAASSVSFTLTNSVIAATDVVAVTIASGATADAYIVTVTATAAGSCRIQVRNNSAGALGEALVLNFAILKAVAA